MQLFLHGHANKRGIYKITNTGNGRYYYGSASKLEDRASSHIDFLRKNKHANLYLQRDYNKCSEDVFIFEVMEVVDGTKEDQIKKEQEYLDKFFDGGKNCYNICPIAGSREGSKNLRPYNPLTDGRHTSRTPEVCADVSKKNKKTWNTPEKKEEGSKNAYKRWNAHSANVTVTNKKTGESVTIKGSLRAWCKGRNVSYRAFHLMVRGKIKSSGGWFLGTEAPIYIERKGEKRKPMAKEAKISRASHEWENVIVKNFITKEEIILSKNIKDDVTASLNYHALRRLLQEKNLFTKNGWYLNKNEKEFRRKIEDVCKECCLVFSSKSGLRNHKRKHQIS